MNDKCNLNTLFPVREVSRLICEIYDNDINRGFQSLIENDNWKDFVLSKGVSPHDCTDPADYYGKIVLQKFFSKTVGLSTGIDTKAVAIDKFNECETQNQITNSRLLAMNITSFTEQVMRLASEKIADILGSCESFVGEEIRFTPGASTTSHGLEKTPIHKIRNCWEVTESAFKHLLDIIVFNPTYRNALKGQFGPRATCFLKSVRYGNSCLYDDLLSNHINLNIELTGGNRQATVPKNAKTDRLIAIEPQGNLSLQKALGARIRARLKFRCGIDLSKQPDVNRELARIGSITGDYATIDLSSASDSITCELVYKLLVTFGNDDTIKWFELLNDVRSPFTYRILPDSMSNTAYKLQSFSTMGNGFTFELETLIFYAFAWSVNRLCNGGRGRLATFGDDIIVPTSIAKPLIEVLSDVGFKTNVDKTFIDGPFRESCGTDWFSGVYVTPTYLRHLSLDYASVNKILEIASNSIEVQFSSTSPYQNQNSFLKYRTFCDKRFLPIRNLLLSRLKATGKPIYFGPRNFGDNVIWGKPRANDSRWQDWIYYISVLGSSKRYFSFTGKAIVQSLGDKSYESILMAALSGQPSRTVITQVPDYNATLVVPSLMWDDVPYWL